VLPPHGCSTEPSSSDPWRGLFTLSLFYPPAALLRVFHPLSFASDDTHRSCAVCVLMMDQLTVRVACLMIHAPPFWPSGQLNRSSCCFLCLFSFFSDLEPTHLEFNSNSWNFFPELACLSGRFPQVFFEGLTALLALISFFT